VTGWQPYPGVDDPGEFESGSARFKVLHQSKAVSGLRNLLTLAHTEYRAPQTESVARPFEDKLSSYPPMPVFAPRVTSGTLETTWPLAERWTFENSLVAGHFKVKRLAMPGDGNAVIDGEDYSIEPRLRYRAADKSWTGFVGLYVFNAKQNDTIDLFGGGAWDDHTQTRSIYGEATVALGPTLDLTAGARWEREHRVRQGTLAFFTTDFDERYENFLPKLTLAWKADAATTLGTALSRGYNGGSAGFTYDVPYVNYEYKPEYVWNLEGFARATRLDGRLQLTGNVFYSRCKDLQTPFDLNPDPAIWAYVVRNAPRAETYGAELGAAWLALPGLTLRADLGLLRARITEYPDSGHHRVPGLGRRRPRAAARAAPQHGAGRGLAPRQRPAARRDGALLERLLLRHHQPRARQGRPGLDREPERELSDRQRAPVRLRQQRVRLAAAGPADRRSECGRQQPGRRQPAAAAPGRCRRGVLVLN
jgi:hypothetical protein